MSQDIYAEFNTFCYAIMLGVLCGIVYDLIRIFRRIIKKALAITVIEDIVYWMAVSIIMFMLMYHENGGMVRAYAIMGMAIGMILYEISIGRFFVKYVSMFLNYIIRLLKIGINKVIKIVKWVLKKVLKPFTIVVKLCRDKNNKYKKKREEKKKKREEEKEKFRREKKGKVDERSNRKKASRNRKAKQKKKRKPNE